MNGDLNSSEDFVRVRDRLEELEGRDSSVNRLFYLSVAPQFYEGAIKSLGASGLAAEEGGWRRALIENRLGRTSSRRRR